MNIYNEPIEIAFECFIAHCLLNGKRDAIENPNQPRHQQGYTIWKEHNRGPHQGMGYFFEKVLPNCQGCVALPFLDGRWGLGVASEAQFYLMRNRHVWVIEPQGQLTERELEHFTQDSLNSSYFRIRPVSEKEILLLMRQDADLVIPHEETRLRTWVVYNQIKRPYKDAHLVRMPIPDGFYSDR